MQVISAMVLVEVSSGATIINQGDLPKQNDCIYLLASGEVDIVIAGGGQGVSTESQQVRCCNRLKYELLNIS